MVHRDHRVFKATRVTRATNQEYKATKVCKAIKAHRELKEHKVARAIKVEPLTLLGQHKLVLKHGLGTLVLQTCQSHHRPVFCIGATSTVSSIGFRVNSTAAAGLTAGYFGIYNQSGTLLAQTANQTTFTAATNYTISFTSSVSLAVGQYYVGYLFVGTTPPTMNGWTGNALVNLGGTYSAGTLAGNGRYMTYSSGLTTLPTISGSATTPSPISGLIAFGLL